MFLILFGVLPSHAQIGEHRDEFSIGVSGGYVMSNVAFVPKVNQGYHGGLTGGISLRYKSEKYFSTICSIMGEINYSQIGWKEDIIDMAASWHRCLCVDVCVCVTFLLFHLKNKSGQSHIDHKPGAGHHEADPHSCVVDGPAPR